MKYLQIKEIFAKLGVNFVENLKKLYYFFMEPYFNVFLMKFLVFQGNWKNFEKITKILDIFYGKFENIWEIF